MALSYEKERKGILKEKARGHKAQILDKEMKFLIFVMGAISSLILLGLYLYLHHLNKDIAYIQTMIFIGLGIDSLFYVLACKNLKKLIWQYNPFDNMFLNFSIIFGWVMFLVALYVPFFQRILKTVPLSGSDWLILIGLGIINIILIEVRKSFFIHPMLNKS
ncbi:MAG: cation transporting ATPase C-terminal domain-containing protein [Bacteroidetes bacterium]|nr:cation transporting ATPase C-terminal domain-containing protein [Bacteroidota bacterium]